MAGKVWRNVVGYEDEVRLPLELISGIVIAQEQQLLEIREQMGRIEALLILVSGKLATDPVKMVEAVGAALGKAQGFTSQSSNGAYPGQPNDLITTPGMHVYEPANETAERQMRDNPELAGIPEGGWADPEDGATWWETMHQNSGMPIPPGEGSEAGWG